MAIAISCNVSGFSQNIPYYGRDLSYFWLLLSSPAHFSSDSLFMMSLLRSPYIVPTRHLYISTLRCAKLAF